MNPFDQNPFDQLGRIETQALVPKVIENFREVNYNFKKKRIFQPFTSILFFSHEHLIHSKRLFAKCDHTNKGFRESISMRKKRDQ